MARPATSTKSPTKIRYLFIITSFHQYSFPLLAVTILYAASAQDADDSRNPSHRGTLPLLSSSYRNNAGERNDSRIPTCAGVDVMVACLRLAALRVGRVQQIE